MLLLAEGIKTIILCLTPAKLLPIYSVNCLLLHRVTIWPLSMLSFIVVQCGWLGSFLCYHRLCHFTTFIYRFRTYNDNLYKCPYCFASFISYHVCVFFRCHGNFKKPEIKIPTIIFTQSNLASRR